MLRCCFVDVFNLHLKVDGVHDVVLFFFPKMLTYDATQMLIVIDANIRNWIQYVEQKDIPSKYCFLCLDFALWMYSTFTSM